MISPARFAAAGVIRGSLSYDCLVEAMASLKSAYIKLQRAHFPYDPAKIAFADEIVTSELCSIQWQPCISCAAPISGIGPLVNERAWRRRRHLAA